MTVILAPIPAPWMHRQLAAHAFAEAAMSGLRVRGPESTSGSDSDGESASESEGEWASDGDSSGGLMMGLGMDVEGEVSVCDGRGVGGGEWEGAMTGEEGLIRETLLCRGRLRRELGGAGRREGAGGGIQTWGQGCEKKQSGGRTSQKRERQGELRGRARGRNRARKR